MKCSNPFMKDGRPLPCGQCPPCRLNRRRIWTHRLILESKLHPQSTFATLTYSDDFVPPMGSLEPRHLQLFWKKLRKAIQPVKIRYYAVGEYGDETFRPHYHAAIFNYPSCAYGRSRYALLNRSTCCPHCDLIRDTWGMGNIDLAELNEATAQYTAGYVTKKMTHRLDPRLKGREPEFSRSSNHDGGIGLGYMDELASTLLQFNLEETQADVPSALRHGKRLLPLGRYLQTKLRQKVGKDEKTPQAIIDEQTAELLGLQKAARANSRTLKEEIIEQTRGAVDALVNKSKIRKQRKTL